jgi:hypothetical protein
VKAGLQSGLEIEEAWGDPFIRVTEVWVPNREGQRLTLAAGLYGELYEFARISHRETFAYDEGLPGKAWSWARPIVLRDFKEPCWFKRSQAARAVGLGSAIALPVYSGDFLMAVVVFLCAGGEPPRGAIEVWGAEDERDELRLVDGYFGNQGEFERVSKRLRLQRGAGFPGRVWKERMPVILGDLGDSASFLRARDARRVGFATGLGIPCFGPSKRDHVMTFLSARATPLARRFEIWRPDAEGKHLVLAEEHGEPDDADAGGVSCIARGEGALGAAWLTGIPRVSRDGAGGSVLQGVAHEGSMSRCLLAIPIIDAGVLRAIVTLCL